MTRQTGIPLLFAAILIGCGTARAEPAGVQRSEEHVTVEFKGEDRDVGLKRMEILDKQLSPELLRKKRAYVRSMEQDYDAKIGALVQRLTTPMGNNTIISHIDINFLDPGFDQQIVATERTGVTILLDRDGFDKWATGKASEEEAIRLMREIIHRTFHLPEEGISIAIAPN